MNASKLKLLYRMDANRIGSRKVDSYGAQNFCIENSFVFGVTRFETWPLKSKKLTFSIVQLFRFVWCENSTFSFHNIAMIKSLFSICEWCERRTNV